MSPGRLKAKPRRKAPGLIKLGFLFPRKRRDTNQLTFSKYLFTYNCLAKVAPLLVKLAIEPTHGALPTWISSVSKKLVYRKRWFVLLTLRLCLPATIFIALSGDVYAKKDGTVYKFKDSALLHLAFMAMIFLIVGLFLTAKR